MGAELREGDHDDRAELPNRFIAQPRARKEDKGLDRGTDQGSGSTDHVPGGSISIDNVEKWIQSTISTPGVASDEDPANITSTINTGRDGPA